jgi:ATP-dependent DNA helicase DinG
MNFMQGVILDFETTGHRPEQDSILQIAAVAVDLRTGCHLGDFATYLHQEWTTVPAYVRKLTGIRREDLIPAPSPEQALRELASFTADAQWVIAHNGRHCEIPFLKLACLQQGIAVRQVHACDTVDLSVRLWGREVRHDLDSALKRLGIPMHSFRRHDARDDASLLTEALRRMLGLINVADPSLGMQCFDGFLPI